MKTKTQIKNAFCGLLSGLLLLAAITPAGHAQTISTVAGNVTFASSGDDGPATSAGLGQPSDVVSDAAGNLYIAQWQHGRVRKVAAGTGIITTIAGTGLQAYSGDGGLATSSSLFHPAHVLLDGADGLYILERSRVRYVALGTGIITTVAGITSSGFSGDGGPATSATLNTQSYSGGLALDAAGNLYIGDTYNHRVRKVAAGTGVITTIAGTGGTGFNGDNLPATSAALYLPNGLAFDGAGNLLIADSFNNRVRKVAAGTGIITTIAGTGAFASSGDGGPASSAGTYFPSAFAFDAAGNLYIDEYNRVRKVNVTTGIISTFAGSGGAGFSGDGGPATSARFNDFDINGGISFDGAGNLYIADIGNNRVRKVTSPDSPPVANAGADFSVNEGQTGVALDGSLSSDPDNDPLTYAWVQLSGTTVTLSDAAAQQPTFTAPIVALGGETLTFELTVTANGETDTDTVDITVVNVNHPPVADAGLDQSVAEGSPVTLHGEDSFDIDNDVFTYAWVQVSGSPTVTITGADTANPTFTAPNVAGSGAPGVVATLVFELTVNDGFPQDAPAPGYTFANVVDSVTVEISNVNNDPTANAGADQTVDEFTGVTLNGAGSSDPDSDPLTYVWQQTGGPAVLDLLGANTATPSFIVPFVSHGGADVTFQLTVDDGYGGIATDTVIVHVQNANDPPLVTAAAPTIGSLWPPNHNLVSIGITGVSDPDNNAIITIDRVTQDEPTNGTGDGDTAIDAFINADGTVLLRAERSGNGNGRVYHIHFTASDPEGSASGVVKVTVPHTKKKVAIDGGELYDSTQ